MNTRNVQAPRGDLRAQQERLAYPINEFCQLSGLGRTTVYRLVGEGKLKLIKVGTKSLITGQSGRDYFASLEQEAA